ncbi:MAG TPA: DUF6179 domain-containing protein, partial [Anaerovoracaceae bacterium]|nr:DUF6179 domain-containing protein [Anaerovoracaceae bacterium]
DRQYKELLFNVYDLILANAIGSLLLSRKEIELHISDYDRQYLQHELSQLPKIKIDELADEAVSRLIQILSLSNSELVDYIKASMVNLKSRLKNALEANGLKLLFLSMEEDITASVIHFEDKTSLDHDHFRSLADDIRECKYISDKIVMLRNEALSINDLIDLLESDCFFDTEYLEVFQSLEDIQLALLIKNLPLDPAVSSFIDDESAREWQVSFNTFLIQMDSHRKSSLHSLANQIAFD